PLPFGQVREIHRAHRVLLWSLLSEFFKCLMMFSDLFTVHPSATRLFHLPESRCDNDIHHAEAERGINRNHHADSIRVVGSIVRRSPLPVHDVLVVECANDGIVDSLSLLRRETLG
ncbi:MAG TPA: hypothetical protein VFA59_11165, partial [Vicinamibacterales bacterium]|nr:hypothetical protein [Vicinamibacterales bacterium]